MRTCARGQLLSTQWALAPWELPVLVSAYFPQALQKKALVEEQVSLVPRERLEKLVSARLVWRRALELFRGYPKAVRSEGQS